MGVVSRIKRALFTKEDTFAGVLHLHKTLGITCLLSYVYRFVNVGPSDMLFTSSPHTLASILVHLLLSVSSLIFKIPVKRIASGYRIWPEYRLHSIVFACRSLAGMMLTWVELKWELQPMYWANVLIVIGTLAAADISSWSVGDKNRSSTIRDLEAGPATHFFFSAMQFHATMGCLLGIRRFSTQFVYVWIIQFNAFLMTIRRKNLLPHNVLVSTYGAMLVFGFIVASYEHTRLGMFAMVNTLGNVAALLRMGMGVPKYPLWLGMAALTQYGRKTIVPGTAQAAMWPYAYATSVALLLLLGAYKINRKRKIATKAAAGMPDTPEVEATPSVEKVKAS